MSGPGKPPAPIRGVDRGTLMRDAVVFQIKLFADGAKDLILSPLGLLAAAISLLTPGRAGSAFYDLMRLGRGFDRRVDLFGAADRDRPGESGPPAKGGDAP